MISAGDVDGYFVYFDASREAVGVRDLTDDEKSVTLDKQVSVSGLIRSDQAEESDGCEHVSAPLRRVLLQLDLMDLIEESENE